ANGSPDPALQIGFSDLTVGPQDPALFHFTPPAGVTVTRPEHQPEAGPRPGDHGEPAIHTQGEGGDTGMLGQLPAAQPGEREDPLAVFQRVAQPVSGPWGQGWVVRTAVVTVLVTADRRVAVGAVSQQVLEEALTR